MMLPINDFNFVVAGIATFAATVGYACTRRLSSSFPGSDSEAIRAIWDQSKVDEPRVPDEPTLVAVDVVQVRSDPDESAAIPTQRNKENLKRKVPHDGFEEPEKPIKSDLGYPHNLAHIYPPPNKRFKTPPGADGNTPTPVEIKATISTESTSSASDPELAETPAPDPPRSPSPVANTPSPVCIDEHEAATPPPSEVLTTPPPPFSQRPQPTTLAPAPATPFGKSSFSGGFAAFAGSTSPFSKAASNNPRSAFKSGRSIWSVTASDLTPHQNDETEADRDIFKPGSPSTINVLEAKPPTSAPSPKNTHLTGEEDEDVEMELKGVKLYVKRGAKSYGEGIPGHLKLLSHRSSSEERILFRREPLWKVTMNVRVQPTVRCAFVPEENALKFILKENIESFSPDSAEVQQELVIYVLKPGRSCSKQDFKDFAQALSENARFRPLVETPPKPSRN